MAEPRDESRPRDGAEEEKLRGFVGAFGSLARESMRSLFAKEGDLVPKPSIRDAVGQAQDFEDFSPMELLDDDGFARLLEAVERQCEIVAEQSSLAREAAEDARKSQRISTVFAVLSLLVALASLVVAVATLLR